MNTKQHYIITNPSSLTDLANQLNVLLSRLSDRLDAMEGYRGTPTFQGDIDLQGNRIINAGAAVATTDVPTLAQAGGSGGDHGALTGLGDDDHVQYVKVVGRHGQGIKVYDANGVLIHGFLIE